MILKKKKKNIMNQLHDDADLNKLYFIYKSPTKDINFNTY